MKVSSEVQKYPFSQRFITITVFLSVVGYITQGVLSGPTSLIIAMCEVAIVTTLFLFILRLFRRTTHIFSPLFLRYFLLLSAVSGFFSLLLWIFAVASNSFPWALSKITLSNGEKTIVYYQMSHIGTSRYYDEVRAWLNQYASRGFTLFLEGVLPGTPENQERLERAIGMKISSGTYASVAQSLGLSAQDESLLEGIPEELLIHADLSVDDIAPSLSSGALRSTPPIDITSELDKLPHYTLGRMALSYIFRAVLNFSLRYTLSSDWLLNMLDPSTVEALLDKRNRIVVDTYIRENPKEAVFLYGALHFDGIFQLLKEQDSRWEIQSLEPLYPYTH